MGPTDLQGATREQLENEVRIQTERADNAESLLSAERQRSARAHADARGQAARADAAEAALDDITAAVARARAHGLAAQAAAITAEPERVVRGNSGLDYVGDLGEYRVLSRPE